MPFTLRMYLQLHSVRYITYKVTDFGFTPDTNSSHLGEVLSLFNQPCTRSSSTYVGFVSLYTTLPDLI